MVDGTKLNNLLPNQQIADSALLDSLFAFNTFAVYRLLCADPVQFLGRLTQSRAA